MLFKPKLLESKVDFSITHAVPGLEKRLDYIPKKDDPLYVGEPLPSALLEKYFEFGSSSKAFLPLTTVREFLMLRFMNQVTDKPNWNQKVFDPKLIKKWRSATTTAGDVNYTESGRLTLTDSMFQYCIAELQHVAKNVYYQRPDGALLVYNGNVVKSDHAIPKSLKRALQQAVKPLEDVPGHEKVWRPGTKNTVLDLAHPSLFPLVYGKTKVLPVGEDAIGLDDCISRCGEGETIGVVDTPPKANRQGAEPYSLKYQWLPCEVDISGDGARITSYVNNIHPHEHADLYQVIEKVIDAAIPLWELALAPLYDKDFDFFQRIPYNEVVYEEGDDDDEGDGEVGEASGEEGGEGEEELDEDDEDKETNDKGKGEEGSIDEDLEVWNVEDEEDGKEDDGESSHELASINPTILSYPALSVKENPATALNKDDEWVAAELDDDESGFDKSKGQEGEGEDEGDYEDEGSQGEMNSDKTESEDEDEDRDPEGDEPPGLVRPEPELFDPRDLKYPESLNLKQRYGLLGRPLQVIIKLVNIALTPRKPKYKGGPWNIEGMQNEHICATALYYYSSSNIKSSSLSFRQFVDAESVNDYTREQDQIEFLPEIFGCQNREPGIQEVGKVVAKEGRLLAFPNILQHKFEPFELADPTRKGHRKVLALFLVDPNVRVISTANVPCQQLGWWRELADFLNSGSISSSGDSIRSRRRKRDSVGSALKAKMAKAISKLPRELKDRVYGQVDGFPITVNDAKETQLKLMKERKKFLKDHGKQLQNENSFSL